MIEQTPLIKFGWLRALLFLIAWFMIQYLAGSLIYFVRQSTPQLDPSFYLLLVSGIGLLVNLPFVFLFRRMVDKKSFTSLGLRWRGFESFAWTGFFLAVAILSIGSLILSVAGNLAFLGFDFAPKDLLMSLASMVFVAITEELVVRGYILNNLMASFNKWIALLISACLFALFHYFNPDFSWVSMMGVFLGGILLGVNYIYTKNLWYGIFFHFIWNFFQGPILGYEVSGIETRSLLVQNLHGSEWLTGGGFGFEASALSLILTLISTILLAGYYHRKHLSFVYSGQL